jgi:hypothetical protein
MNKVKLNKIFYIFLINKNIIDVTNEQEQRLYTQILIKTEYLQQIPQIPGEITKLPIQYQKKYIEKLEQLSRKTIVEIKYYEKKREQKEKREQIEKLG